MKNEKNMPLQSWGCKKPEKKNSVKHMAAHDNFL
jgi:hypothetical protein